MRKAEPSDFMKKQLGIPIEKVSIPESIPCDICGKQVPVTVCEHGYPQDELCLVTLPDRDGGNYDPYCGCDMYLCAECIDELYKVIDTRAQLKTT